MESANQKNVFITGASGFIGSALVELLSNQEVSLHCLVNKSRLKSQNNRIKICQGNFMDFDWSYLDENKINVFYHFARMNGKTRKERQKAATLNARANSRLLEYLNKMNNPPRLIFGSGTLVYGENGENFVDEEAPIRPISYQREYFKAEEPILQALKSSNIPIFIVRPPWIYGSESWFKWLFWKHIQQQNAVPVYGNGRNLMSLIHIEDCAGLIRHIAEFGEAGHIYNISAHKAITQNDFANLLSKLTEFHVKRYPGFYLRFRMNKAAREAMTFSLSSTSRFKDLLNKYEMQHPNLEAGLTHVLNQLREN